MTSIKKISHRKVVPRMKCECKSPSEIEEDTANKVRESILESSEGGSWVDKYESATCSFEATVRVNPAPIVELKEDAKMIAQMEQEKLAFQAAAISCPICAATHGKLGKEEMICKHVEQTDATLALSTEQLADITVRWSDASEAP